MDLHAVFFCSSWFITLFTSSFQYTEYSFLALKVMDLVVAKGFRALFKGIIALLIHFRERLLKMNFEQVLEFLNGLTEHEIFTNKRYNEFLVFKKKGMRKIEIRKIMKETDDYEFVYNFKEMCKGITVSEGLLIRLETRYKFVNEKLGF